MTGVGFLIGGVITAVTAPPTAFAVSGIGVVVLVLLAAIFRVVPDSPVPAPLEPSDPRRFERTMADASHGPD